jgi:hypothetical protein
MIQLADDSGTKTMITGTAKSVNPSKGRRRRRHRRAVVKDLHVSGIAAGKPEQISKRSPDIARCIMTDKSTELSVKKRTWIARADLETALAGSIRDSDPKCESLIAIIVERIVPASPDGANWTVKGVRYGKAEREACNSAIARFVEEGQREYEVSDWT